MNEQNELRDRIAEVVHDENERLRSDNGLRYDPLKYDELPDKHRENRESIAQAIIDSGIIADLWDEGYEEAAKYHSLDTEHGEPNPYRIGEEA